MELVSRLSAGATSRHAIAGLSLPRPGDRAQGAAGMQQCSVDPIDGWILFRHWFHEKMP